MWAHFFQKSPLYLLHPPFIAHLVVEICHKKTLDFMQNTLVIFLHQKRFNHIIKAANIFHLKSSTSHRLNYFSIFTPSKHTSHHHGQPIANCQFLTWRNMVDLLQVVDYGPREIWHLLWTNLTSYNFSIFLFPTALYIFPYL